MSEEIYRVKIGGVFEGPMDLLVYLIKKNEVNVYDIPIALITDQYLEYLEMLKIMNIDLAGEFIVMAATLIHIKSKLLLPVHKEVEGDDLDPRLEITRPLVEYLRIKSAAESLISRNILGEDTFIRSPQKVDGLIDAQDELIQIGLFELIDAFQKILKHIALEQRVDLTADRISVKDRISEIVDILEERGSVAFDELFEKTVEKSDIIVTFLAILEMVRLAIIRIFQHVESGIIRLFYQ
ncbi:MAG: chromosome segregation protein ScpA [Deltaproteobacteria bacterium RBG_13_49_15]|nr:MAG: chromosome segregation protein ScpA [Deltaproteobacteria bacterium RBG_13_49_15]